MIKLPEQELFFAVLDGDDPTKWRPWPSEQTLFGALAKDCAGLVEPPPNNPPSFFVRTKFRPILSPITEVMESDNLGAIVGVIIQADQDPDAAGAREFYEKKMAELEGLCTAIRWKTPAEKHLIASLRQFEVWFLGGKDRSRWGVWHKRARTIVEAALQGRVRLDHLMNSEFFAHCTEGFLENSSHWLMRKGS